MRTPSILVGFIALAAVAVGLVALRGPADAAFPGGNGQIAFQGESPSWDWDIYAINADGSGQTNLTNSPGTGDESPAWSPDGSKIAFHSWTGGYAGIYVMNADGSGRTRLTKNHEASDQAPAWSPDGSKIAFQSLRDGNPQIYVMNADGSGQTRLTENGAWELQPAWSPDGSKIAFATNRDVNFEVYVMNADGSGQTNLSNNPAYDDAPDWSPDGSKIAFRSGQDGSSANVYVMNPDGSEQTRLTDDPMYDGQPAWSPDGSKIAFVSYRDLVHHHIYVMNADGSEQTRLTDHPKGEGGPNWQPVVACPPEGCPTPVGQPTPTNPPKPTPTAMPSGEPELALNVKGGGCDEPSQPSECSVYLGRDFILSVDAVRRPSAGYVLAQTFIVYGGELVYKPAESAADEFAWPDLEALSALRSEKGPGLVNHGGLTSITTPMPVSKFEGTIVQLAFTCSADPSTTEVALLEYEHPVATTYGSVFVLPDAVTKVVPKVSSLTIHCVEPPPDFDGDGCSDEREKGPNAALGGQRNYLNPWDFYDVAGAGGSPPDGVVDLPNDILGVTRRYTAGGGVYDAAYDRGPTTGPNAWNMTTPDGTIDLPNDILGVIQQYQHDCREA